MKKKIGTIQMALSFAGCFLGAGFVSGQEICQYFLSYGRDGFFAFGLSMVLLCLFSALVMIAQKTGKRTFDELMIGSDIPWLKGLVSIFMVLFFMSISSIMAAGIGSLGRQVFGFPEIAGCVVTVALTAVIAFYGLDGMVSVFSAAVPVLLVAAVVISGIAIARTGFLGLSVPEASGYSLLGSWATSAVNYTALNYFGSVGILAPLVFHTKKEKNVVSGVILGTVFLVLLGGLFIAALCTAPDYSSIELPMLTLSGRIGAAAYYIYALLMFLGMFGCCVSSTVAVIEYGKEKTGTFNRHTGLWILVISVFEFAASSFGFTDLVGYAYPVFGYMGIATLVMTVVNAVKVFGKR